MSSQERELIGYRIRRKVEGGEGYEYQTPIGDWGAKYSALHYPVSAEYLARRYAEQYGGHVVRVYRTKKLSVDELFARLEAFIDRLRSQL